MFSSSTISASSHHEQPCSTQKDEERRRGLQTKGKGWVLVETWESGPGGAAGQVREGGEKGLRETEGGGTMIKQEA